MAAGNLSSTFRFPGIFHSNFQYGGRILKGSSDWLKEVQKAQWAKIMLNHIGTINTSHQITTTIPQHPLLPTSPSWVLCAIEPPWISAIPPSCGCRTPSIAMPELSFLMAEVFRFVSNGCQFGPTHCHVCGPMSGLAQCHSACFTTRTEIQENWGPDIFCLLICWWCFFMFLQLSLIILRDTCFGYCHKDWTLTCHMRDSTIQHPVPNHFFEGLTMWTPTIYNFWLGSCFWFCVWQKYKNILALSISWFQLRGHNLDWLRLLQQFLENAEN